MGECPQLIRPANYPAVCPGKGYALCEVRGHTVAVMNLQGRTFMAQELDCPFRAADSLLTFLRSKTNIIFVDFHAETTSEKQGMAFYLDGRVSGVYGTHTHVQTADEMILPGGTSYITDLGFAGAKYSMLGMSKEPVLHKFLTQMRAKFTVELTGPMVMNGIWVEVDASSGKTLTIERFKVIDEEIASSLAE
jgi:metallophosphoesterase (TIGR00282 family)